MRWIDLFLDSSTCAFLECDGARLGTTGVSGVGIEVSTIGVGVAFRSKNDLECSIGGVIGVAGDEMSIEESSLPFPRKLRSMVEKSESFPECIESLEDFVEIDRMSGAVKA